ncbi:MAG: aminotransferase class I/II-fold pyridoxal phosphate-dependent enzyme [Bacteroidota bacterium]
MSFLHLVRPEIRAETAYRVPTTTHVDAKVDQNESPFDLPESVKQAAIADALATPWNRYPDDRPHRLIAALADRWEIPAEGLIVGHGSNEIAHTIGLCFLSEGTPVVLPHPMFALYASVARMHGARLVEVDPRPDFGHDASAILDAAVGSNAPLTIVTTPNNPTGQSISHENLNALAEGVPGVLLIDEAYHEFVTGPTALDLVKRHDNVLVMRTFSKAMGMAGVRLGTLIGAPDLIQEIEKARVPFLVDRWGEALGLAMLDHADLIDDRVRQLVASRDELFAWVTGLEGVEAIPSDANFFLFRTPLDASVLRAQMAERGVLIRDVTGYPALAPREGTPGWTRVSIGTDVENAAFREALSGVLRDAGAAA